jgi:hypothetical protein
MSLYRGYNLDENAFDEMDNISEEAMDTYVNLIAYDNITNVDEAQIKEFCNGPVGQALLEKSVLNKGTMMRLSKQDDKNRRVKLFVYQLASEKKDKDYIKMKAYRAKWKACRAKLMQKYGRKATMLAQKSQQEYIKRARSEKSAAPEHK